MRSPLNGDLQCPKPRQINRIYLPA